MKTTKTSFVLIAVILAAVATLSFLVLDVTAVFVIGYLFTLLAIAALLFSALFLLDNVRTYPWGAAIPLQAASYLAVVAVVSIAAVLLERFGAAISPTWFFVVQAAILAFFAIRIVALNVGRVEIERVDGKLRADTAGWKALIVETEALAARSAEVKPVLDAIRYSDPVSDARLADCEKGIRDGIGALRRALDTNEPEKIGALRQDLLCLINERNAKAKLLKS